jgi:hypothetical protein
VGNTATALNDQAVNAVFRSCLHQDGDDPFKTVPVQHITHQPARFNQHRLDTYRDGIHGLVSQLPDRLRETGGGSFVYVRLDRNGSLWTRFEPIRERVVQLGVAVGEIQFVYERRYWIALYKELPYVRIGRQ